jgi:lysophospholipase L1-like esterase
VLDETTGAPAGNGAPAWMDDATVARFTHHARLPLPALVGLDPDLALRLDARFVGCPPGRLAAIRREHADTVARTAAGLLAERATAAAVARLAAVTGPRIAVLGDSVTADSLGWAELLAACLRAAGTGVTVANLAVSGFTSGEAIPLLDLVVRERPSCVLAMLGTNDGRRHGAAGVRAVSTGETRRNLRALRELVGADAGARFVPVAPPPMDQARHDAGLPPGATVRFHRDELAATLGAVRAALPGVIDVPALLGEPVPAGFWLPDGVHPSLEGQTVLARLILHAVAGSAPAA